MTPDQVTRRCIEARQAFYSCASILKRGLDFKVNGQDLFMWAHFFSINFLFRSEVLRRKDFPLGDESYTAPLIKARHGAKEWGVPCVGEDSGIEILGLANLPGPWSARFSAFTDSEFEAGIKARTLAGIVGTSRGNADDKANNDTLLRLLRGKRGDDRLCRYVAALALVAPNGDVLYCNHATVDGRVLDAPKGASGFGYDPIVEFFDYPGRSVAELEAHEKNIVSHRGQVTQNLLGWLARRHA